MSQEQSPRFAAVVIRGGMDVRLLFEKGRKSGILVAKSFPAEDPDIVRLFGDVVLVIGSTSRSNIRGRMFDCTTKRDPDHGVVFRFSPSDYPDVETPWAPTPTRALRQALVEVASKLDGVQGDDLIKFKKLTAVLDGRLHSCFFSDLYNKVIHELYPEVMKNLAENNNDDDAKFKVKPAVKRVRKTAPSQDVEEEAPPVLTVE